MSRWLTSVNNLLEQLDGTVGEAIEQGAIESEGGPTSSSVDDILNRRGLTHTNAADDDNNELFNNTETDYDEIVYEEENKDSEENEGVEAEQEIDFENDDDKKIGSQEKLSPVNNNNNEQLEEEKHEEFYDVKEDVEDIVSDDNRKIIPDQLDPKSISTHTMDDNAQNQSSKYIVSTLTDEKDAPETKKPTPKLKMNITSKPKQIASSENNKADSVNSVSHKNANPVKVSPTANLQVKLLEKEIHKLRRNIVSLNAQLESIEHEMSAQATELQQAGQRMEQNRNRHKEQIKRLTNEHEGKITLINKQHATEILSVQENCNQQINDLTEHLQSAEYARAKEGGDYEGELKHAIEREQQLRKDLIAVQQDKAGLNNSVSGLQSQITHLQSNLESLSITADTSNDRETQAQDRLDAALALHAKQISQRQSREQELERTIADLTAALVVSKQKQTQRNFVGHIADAHLDNSGANIHTELQIQELTDQLDTMKAQLDIGRLQTTTLHQELHDMSQERTEEEANNLARQRHYERKIAELSSTVVRLQAANNSSSSSSTATKSNTLTDTLQNDSECGTVMSNERMSEDLSLLKKQISSLSEQALRQQSKTEHQASEITTLQNRLREAIQRAEVAEADTELQTASNYHQLHSNLSSLPLYSASKGNANTSRQGRMRRRGGGNNNRKGTVSIRSAMNLTSYDSNSDEPKEKIGKAIDALDKFSVETGNYLRHNPLARGAFIAYLLLLHIWTLVLLVFHAHSYEEVHGDFGNENIGVNGLIRHSYRIQEQLPKQP